jgi:type IV pilus assembly protein PilM
MVSLFQNYRCGPIGVDIGSRSVKLLQLSADRSRVVETARWDLPAGERGNAQEQESRLVEAITRAREGRRFRGRDAVFCIGADGLFVQNIRVAPSSAEDLEKIVRLEAASRLPFSTEEAEIRYLSTDDVRQGDSVRREIILMACRHNVVGRLLSVAERAGLRPAAIDAEPVAMLRAYVRQLRRDEDQQQRRMYVNVGATNTSIIIARGADAMFVKYLDLGGRHFDESVARNLRIPLAEAVALRRHNGDRRADQRDPEITRSIAESVRPLLERLAHELSLCIRYFSVTFRGQSIAEMVLGGGEASPTLLQWLAGRVDVPCELGNPLRSYQHAAGACPAEDHIAQWDVAAGLALREMN